MTFKIPLQLSGIDLRDEGMLEAVDVVDDLSFQAYGAISLAVVYTQDANPLPAAEDAVRRINKLMPGCSVRRVHDELVSMADIAARCGVGHEAVRLWVNGRRRSSLRPFPVPVQEVGASGGRMMSLWTWREVVAWVRDVIGVDPDEGIEYLTDDQVTELSRWIFEMQRPNDLFCGTAVAANRPPDVSWHSVTFGDLAAELWIARGEVDTTSSHALQRLATRLAHQRR